MASYYDLKNAYDRKLPREEILELYRGFEDKEALYDGDALMHCAAYNIDPDAIDLLLDAGVKAMVLNSYNRTPLHILADHERYYRKPSYERVYGVAKKLLDAKVSALRKDDNEHTCYHIAAANGTYGLIQALIDSGAKLNMTDKDGLTALHIACEEVRHALSSQKHAQEDFDRRSNQPEEKDESWERRRLETLRECAETLEQANQKVENYFNIVKALLDYGFDPDTKNNYGRDALYYAVENDAKKIAALLKGELSGDAGADGLAIAAGGMTLHQALQKNDIAAVSALIQMGADVNEVSNEYEFEGQTPLAVACRYVCTACVDALLAAGADPNFKAGEHGRTALYFLIANFSANVRVDDFFKNKHVQTLLKSMVKAGLDINGFVDDDANTALLLNCKRGPDVGYNSYSVQKDLITDLVDLQCDVNLANLNGETPLMILAVDRFVSENLFITLLENGADVSVCDKKGNTPLMYAAKNSQQNLSKSIIELMMDFGDVKIDAVNNDGKTALDIATEENHEEVVKLLLTNM